MGEINPCNPWFKKFES